MASVNRDCSVSMQGSVHPLPCGCQRPLDRLVCQCRIGEPLPTNSARRVGEALAIPLIPRVETKRLFVHVAVKVIIAHLVVSADDHSLEQAPEVLYAVGVNAASDILSGMVNEVVLVCRAEGAIRLQGIRVDDGSRRDVRENLALQFAASRAVNHHRADLAVALQHAHDESFIGEWAAMALLPLVLVLFLAADPRLISLHGTREGVIEALDFHSEPDAMIHEPCRLLSHAERAGHLVGADAFLAGRHHPHSREPLIKADRRVFKDGPDLDTELLFAAVAAPDSTGHDEMDSRAPTPIARAHNAVRPAHSGHKLTANVRIGEVADGVHKGCRESSCVHIFSLREDYACVKYVVPFAKGN